MAINLITQSLHGRKFGLSASGGVVIGKTSATGGVMSHLAEISSAGKFESSVDGASAIGEWGSSLTGYKGFVETIDASDDQMVNYGLSHITSDVINGSTILISTPEIGIKKEIFLDSSASTISIGTTAAGITFGASVGSSVYNMDAAGGTRGTGLILQGLSATRWAFLARHKLGD